MVKKCLDNNICSNFVGHVERLQHGKNTRNNNICVKISKIKLESSKKSFLHRGAIEFNKLPCDIRAIESYMLICFITVLPPPPTPHPDPAPSHTRTLNVAPIDLNS